MNCKFTISNAPLKCSLSSPQKATKCTSKLNTGEIGQLNSLKSDIRQMSGKMAGCHLGLHESKEGDPILTDVELSISTSLPQTFTAYKLYGCLRNFDNNLSSQNSIMPSKLMLKHIQIQSIKLNLPLNLSLC